MEKKQKIMSEIIREVYACLDNNCCIAGLSLALLLPDICGKAIYQSDLTPSKRYIKWVDEYIGQYEQDENNIHIGINCLNGEQLYSLRNSVLHQGNPNIDHKKFGVEYFELLYRAQEGGSIVCSTSESEIIKDDNGNDKEINKKICVNVRVLCIELCRFAELCYEQYEDKFDFFNYNLVDTDFKTRRAFGMNDRELFK